MRRGRAVRRSVRLALAGALAAAAACGPAEPDPHVRLAAWAPGGAGAPLDAVARLDFSGPLDPAQPAGVRVALARGADARAVAAAAGSEAGLAPSDPAIPCDLSLDPTGRRLTLRPLLPLAAGQVHALVVGTLRDAGGRPVLDPEGHRRTFVATFETVAAPPGPPPRPVLAEALADAATPEAGGEYLEVWNVGEGPLDLTGWRVAKRTASGAWTTCTADLAEGAPIAPGAAGLLTGGAWDGRYAVPVALPRYACGATALAGGLANDRALELRLLDPAGQVRSTLGEGGAAPRCPGAVERIDPEGPDAPENWACAEGTGTPGACNDATPAALCP